MGVGEVEWEWERWSGSGRGGVGEGGVGEEGTCTWLNWEG